MNHREISLFLSELEEKVAHDSFLFHGVNLWPMIRNYVSGYLIRSNRKRYSSLRNQKHMSAYFLAFLISLVQMCFSSRPDRVKSLMIVTDQIYQVQIASQVIDRVFCGFEDMRGDAESVLMVNLANTNFDNLNAKSYSWAESFFFIGRCFSMSFAALMVSVGRLCGLIRKVLGIHLLINEAQMVCNACRDKGISLDYKILVRNALSVYFHSIWIGYFFRNRNFTSIHEANSFDSISAAINIASSKRGIKTICHQHGGQSQSNPYFSKWSMDLDLNLNPFCETYSCWDNESAKSIRNWKINGAPPKTIIEENKWLSVSKSLSVLSLETRKDTDLFIGFFNVVVTLQPSFNISEEVLQDLLNYDDSIKLWVRFHPAMVDIDNHPIVVWGEDISRVEIQNSRKFTLPELFALSELHLTASSSSVMEAVNANVYTVFLSENACSYFHAYIEAKQAEYLDDRLKLNEILYRFNI